VLDRMGGWARIGVVLFGFWIIVVASIAIFERFGFVLREPIFYGPVVVGADPRGEDPAYVVKNGERQVVSRNELSGRIAVITEDRTNYVRLGAALFLPPLIILALISGCRRIYRWISAGFDLRRQR
jgi:hypothetical protein